MRAPIDRLAKLTRVIFRGPRRRPDRIPASIRIPGRTNDTAPGMTIRKRYPPAEPDGMRDGRIDMLVRMFRSTDDPILSVGICQHIFQRSQLAFGGVGLAGFPRLRAECGSSLLSRRGGGWQGRGLDFGRASAIGDPPRGKATIPRRRTQPRTSRKAPRACVGTDENPTFRRLGDEAQWLREAARG